MRAVADLLARARPGPAALMVEGEAGIGKTTLVLHALEVARNQGFSVLSAHGSVAEVEYAYAAVADSIGGIDQAVLAKLTSQQRRALDRAQDALTAGAPDIDERTIAAAFCAAIENLSATSPVLLALDDAQWLEPSSRAVIGSTARRLSGAVACWSRSGSANLMALTPHVG
jgi:predicted ATPase